MWILLDFCANITLFAKFFFSLMPGQVVCYMDSWQFDQHVEICNK